MDLVPGFQALLQGISAAMTAPSFASLCTIASGWLFSGRGIVTRMIVAAGHEALLGVPPAFQRRIVVSGRGWARAVHDDRSIARRCRDARPRRHARAEARSAHVRHGHAP